MLRGMDGGGVEMGMEGIVERLPDVVNDVKSRISGKIMRMLFLAA